MYNIVTSICVDTDANGAAIEYPTLGEASSNKREIYWKCVFTFCVTSLRFNPDKTHYVFTNDKEEVTINGIPIRKSLEEIGVKIKVVKFDTFDPGKYSLSFRNAFYKLQTINSLSKLSKPSILLDSDCVWSRADEDLDFLMSSGNHVLLQDTYRRSHTPHLSEPHNLSMADMGRLYSKIPVGKLVNEFPVWYGGELIGAAPKHFQQIASRIEQTLAYLKEQIDLGEEFKFSNGHSIMSNEEYLSSYGYNTIDLPIYDTYLKFSKRIWTMESPNNVSKEDLDIPIWHLPVEKLTGICTLFDHINKRGINKWNSSHLKDFPLYLGGLMGIPKRRVSPYKKLTLEVKKQVFPLVRRFRPSSIK